MKEELQDRIDAYLLNRMSDEERLAFEKEIDSNKELQEQLSFTKNVQQALKSRNDKLAKMSEWEKDTEHKVGPRMRRQIYYWISGFAAVFIVGIFVLSTYFAPMFRGTFNESLPNEYQKIEKLLADNDFDKALDEIEKAEYEIFMQDMYEEIDTIEVVDTVTADSVGDYDIYDSEVSESFGTTEVTPDRCDEPESEKRDDNITDNIEEAQKSDDIYTLDSVVNPKNKEKLEYLYFMKAKALIGLNRIGEALLLLDKLRSSDNKYKTQADSLYKSINQ